MEGDNMDSEKIDDSVSIESFICTVKATAHDIKPKDEEKRVRVFSSQLLGTFVYDITLKNYLEKIILFFKYGNNLIKKYPLSESLIRNAYIDFWARTQQKLKTLKNQDGKIVRIKGCVDSEYRDDKKESE